VAVVASAVGMIAGCMAVSDGRGAPLHTSASRTASPLPRGWTKVARGLNGGSVFAGRIPGWLEQRYQSAAGNMLKWWRLLMTNTRMLVLFIVLFLGQPVYYFWFELIPLNVLFIYLIVRQEKMAKSLERLLVTQRCSA